MQKARAQKEEKVPVLKVQKRKTGQTASALPPSRAQSSSAQRVEPHAVSPRLTPNAILNQFLEKAKKTHSYLSLGDEECKEAFLRVRELQWRYRRMELDKPVPAIVSWEEPNPRAPRPKHTNEGLEQLLKQKPNESIKQYFKRLQKLLHTYEDYNAMLSIEGEDAWSDESHDSFEGRVEWAVEDILDAPQNYGEEIYEKEVKAHRQIMEENVESEILEESESEDPEDEEPGV